ncbi:MAG: glycoside hydrolase family 92 protein [Lewinellaceae bacterium]|nr:glycoside hydrolase family 92 protein [Lewinellaceae bacterium]
MAKSLFGGHPLSCKSHFFGDTALLFLTVPLGTLFKKTPCLTKKLPLFAIKSGLQTSSKALAPFFTLLSVISVLVSCKPETAPETATGFDPIPYVNPNIGTAHSRWFFYTPAARPFGMAKLGPTTDAHYGNKSGWEAVGYDERHTSIEGFSHAREFQVGGIITMPTTGELVTVPGELDKPDSGYRSRFDKGEELAQPGYYKVRLKDYDITAELTATPRVGFHRYAFPAHAQCNILFDIGNVQGESGPILDASVKVLNNREVEGMVVTAPYYVGHNHSVEDTRLPVYFYAQLSRPADAVGTFRRDSIFAGQPQASGVGAGAYFTFRSDEAESVELKVAISFTSTENARLNFEAEAPGKDFDAVKAEAQEEWKKELGKILVEGGREADRVKFYTGLYHALLGRGRYDDVNGAYPRNDGSTGQLPLDGQGRPLYDIYNTDAIWGGYWNLTQLWALAWPDYYNDFVQTHLRVYQDAGWLGDGLANSKYVSGVGTNFVGLVIAAAYNCGIRNYDVNLAYEAALKNELEWRNRPPGAGKLDMRGFVEKGFVPFVDTWEAGEAGDKFCVSRSLEYAFGAYAVAQMAGQLGKADDYKRLMDMAGYWQASYDATTGFVRPRYADGTFVENFDPFEAWRGFQEGNAWQYTFYVPHDPESLVALMGAEEFNNRLDSVFTQAQETAFGGGKEVNAFAGVASIYNHGNQPSLHISWLFNHSGKPWLTQKWTRAICDEFYGTDGIHGYGYGQDEDQGQLGAWYVMAAIGLFDVKGLSDKTPQMQIGSPIFGRITIALNPEYAGGESFVIETHNNSPENVYVQSATFNGKPLEEARINYADIVKGGRLVLEMGPAPAQHWGSLLPPQ